MIAESAPERRLVIIGNAYPEEDYSAFVNTSEWVLRFNKCPHYHLRRTGTKTTILCLLNEGVGRDLTQPDSIPRAVCAQVREVWFSRPATALSRQIIDAHGLRHLTTRHISRAMWTSLLRKLRQRGRRVAGYPVWPSTGAAGIELAVHDVRFRDYEKCILAFTWNGWIGHPWDAERRLCLEYAAAGALRLGPPMAATEPVA